MDQSEPSAPHDAAHPEPIEGSSFTSPVQPQLFDPAQPEPGLYAIVEVLGHRTFAGRVAEVERFGTRLLQVEPLYQHWLLPPVLLGGGSIYQFTPCDAATAWDRRARHEYELQGGLAAIAARLPKPDYEPPAFLSFSLTADEGEPA